MSYINAKASTAQFPEEAQQLRHVVSEFIAGARKSGLLQPPTQIGIGFSAEMSRRLGEAGLIGLTWPEIYGGHARTALERYVVTEELLAAAVPVGAHWVADRQSGPVLLRFGSEAQRLRYLPAIARGECFFCIGMSEPDSGSDLASLRSRAEKTADGWRINGRKVWTTNAHRAHFMITLARTSPKTEDSRHRGFSQFIIDLKAPGVTVRPVINITGEHDFNEVILDDVMVDDAALVGEEGNGWNQVSAELAYERSGPERWLSSFRLLQALADVPDIMANPAIGESLGRLLGQLMALRQLSISVAVKLQQGATPNTEAAIVKDLGTRFEQEVVRIVRDIAIQIEPEVMAQNERLRGLVASAQMWGPAFTIRGGTVEILRGIIARGLSLR
jgi:alkylation response protein AidB-like acyl-CoA dehydrogenase